MNSDHKKLLKKFIKKLTLFKIKRAKEAFDIISDPYSKDKLYLEDIVRKDFNMW